MPINVLRKRTLPPPGRAVTEFRRRQYFAQNDCVNSIGHPKRFPGPDVVEYNKLYLFMNRFFIIFFFLVLRYLLG